MDPDWLLRQFGQEMFWISLAIIFIECGLFFPFLPGDTLLFALGIFIATDDITILDGNPGLDLTVAITLFTIAAFLGNVTGYEIGRRAGPPLFAREGRYLNTKNLEKTHTFFERYGNKALVLGRFVPIVRTYITVVAGAGEMDRRRFFSWSLVGAVLWATGLTLLGYFLGSKVPFLRDHLEAAVLLIVLISTVPIVIEYLRERRRQPARR